MAMNETSEESNENESWWVEAYRSNEVKALWLIGFAAILALSLFCYAPVDLPEWVVFAPENSAAVQTSNWTGPAGAVLAGHLYYLFGAAACIIPAVFVWWAGQILITRRSFRIRNYISLTILTMSVACIVQCQPLFFQDWIARFDLPGSSGGLVGKWVGQQAFVSLFGPAGTFIIMLIVCLLALVVVTGIHPFQFAMAIGDKISSTFRRVDWEKKWTLWSGVEPPEEPAFASVQRALPVSRTITVEPLYEEEVIITHPESDQVIATEFVEVPIPETVTFDSEEIEHLPEPPTDVQDDEEEDVEIPIPVPVKADAPCPKRIRKIIDASQRHHQKPGSASKENNIGLKPFVGKPQFEHYQLPTFDVLGYADDFNTEAADTGELIATQNQIVDTLNSFNVEVQPGDITKGPTITRYEVYPTLGLRVGKIAALKADIARATRAEKINILAPIPGKETVGIEIANSDKITVALRELFESEVFHRSTAKLPLVLGKDVYGKTIIGDLSKMPHLLVAGATGSGKSVCINSIIASLLYRFTPDELKFIMIDPKVVEMQLYNSLPHMVIPVVTDPKKVLLALRWVINEMERRYELFAKKGSRNFEGYNNLRSKEAQAQQDAERKALQPNLINTETGEDFLQEEQEQNFVDVEESSEPPERLPYIVVIIDELADLMQTAPADIETSIARIAQKARAAGIHLIVATQTPRADVVTGIIKANIPSRIAFQVSSKMDSRIILDANGAENLVGKGDMLYLPPGSAQLIRAQGALITDEEAQALVDVCAAQGKPVFESEGLDLDDLEPAADEQKSDISDADEELIGRCMEVIFTEKKASTSLLQRKLRLGYTRAARMIDILEDRGIIGPGDGAKPREILIDLTADPETV